MSTIMPPGIAVFTADDIGNSRSHRRGSRQGGQGVSSYSLADAPDDLGFVAVFQMMGIQGGTLDHSRERPRIKIRIYRKHGRGKLMID